MLRTESCLASCSYCYATSLRTGGQARNSNGSGDERGRRDGPCTGPPTPARLCSSGGVTGRPICENLDLARGLPRCVENGVRRYLTNGIPTSLQILRASWSLTSECRGTDDRLFWLGFHHQECRVPSRRKAHPCLRRCLKRAIRFIQRRPPQCSPVRRPSEPPHDCSQALLVG